jgi:uncharacterized protein (TIGR03067 family)
MRQLTTSLLFCLAISCATTRNTNTNSNILNGTWLPVQQEFSGTVLPKAAFEKQKLIINNSSYTLIAESVDKGVVKYKDDKMDIYGKEGVNAGKHFTAIYKFENEQLTICYNLTGTSYPEAFETKGKPMYFLSVFKKE